MVEKRGNGGNGSNGSNGLHSVPVISTDSLESLCKIVSRDKTYFETLILPLVFAAKMMDAIGVDHYEERYASLTLKNAESVPEEGQAVFVTALNELMANTKKAHEERHQQ